MVSPPRVEMAHKMHYRKMLENILANKSLMEGQFYIFPIPIHNWLIGPS